MVCPPVRRDNPRALALARGLSTVQAHKSMFFLTCTMISSGDFVTGYLVLKIGYLGIVVQLSILIILFFLPLSKIFSICQSPQKHKVNQKGKLYLV